MKRPWVKLSFSKIGRRVTPRVPRTEGVLSFEREESRGLTSTVGS